MATASKYPIKPQFEKIKQLIAEAEADVTSHDEKSNHAAGVRVRKAMQELKVVAQGVRETLVLK